jgi:ubiquinone/menaquinone biosynthesis C-methylase UbiE
MLEIPEYLRCPVSHQRLVVKDDDTVVSICGRYEYRRVFGICDLRIFDAPYRDLELELRLVGQLATAAQRMSYAELVRYYESELLAGRPAARIARGIEHRLTLLERAPQRLQKLLELAGNPELSEGSWVLDLGCGSGEAVRGLLASGAGHIVGVDISLTELVLGRKLLAEQGMDVVVVAGCAEALPFRDGLFDWVFSGDVIEHVRDQAAYLRETCRILKPGGVLLMNSPNRFSLFAPEPHVGLWWLTLLPRAWFSPVCRLAGKGPYIGKRLISLPEFRRLLAGEFASVTIVGRPSNNRTVSMAGRLYSRFAPFSENLFAYVCPEHTALARRAPLRSGPPS